MYKVMLIDDDVPMLEYVEHLLRSLEPELTVVASAYSSELALEQFRQRSPDLVITDIGMPVMDGMRLAQLFRELKPDVQLIFLTCYEDFNYSKTAFQLEADDYLIKDELTEEQFARSISKSLTRLKRKQELLERHSLRQDFQRNKDLLKQQFLKELLGGGPAQAKQTLPFGERLGITWRKPAFLMAVLHADASSMAERYQYKDFGLIHYAIYNIAEDLIPDKDSITPILLQDEALYLFWNGNAEETALGRESLVHYMELLREKTLAYLKVELTGLYTEKSFRLEELRSRYGKMDEFKDCNYYGGPSFSKLPEIVPVWSGGEEERFEREKDMLLLSRDENNTSWMDMSINRVLYYSEEMKLKPSLFTAALSRMANHAAYQWGVTLPEDFHAYLQRAVRAEEAAKLTKRQLKQLLLAGSGHNTGSGKDPKLAEIDEYLAEHSDVMVTSMEMAEHLHLNASYFSRYFKRLAGVNFTDYVNQFKVELAISLLQRPNETVENVAYTLGFSDRAYFSKVFKKYSGKSPSEFKPPLAP